MTKTTKKCNDNCACTHEAGKQTGKKESLNYGFYSKVLNKPFDSLSELHAAEALYYAEQKAKEDKVAQKKADAQKVEDAFKQLNATRKAYKESLSQLTAEYSEALKELKDAFELGKKDITEKLVAAEDAYSVALKEFTDKYENYHMTLKDGDFETTISNQVAKNIDKNADAYTDIFKWVFGI